MNYRFRIQDAALAAVLVLSACGEDRAGTSAADTQVTEPAGIVWAVQVSALGDSSAAQQARDSLQDAGWTAIVSRRPDGMWAIRLNPTPDSTLARMTAFALDREGSPGAFPVRDSLPGGGKGRVVIVNQQTVGMATRSRWARSPDGRTLLLVDDPAGVENEPVSNGFFVGSDGVVPPFRMDSVWDVEPSPDWLRLAVSRAHVLRAGEADSLPTERWAEAGRLLNISADSARKASFPASGMAYMFGLARPGIVDLRSGETRWFDAAGGWRVGWNREGTRLFAGSPTGYIADDAGASGWIAFDSLQGWAPVRSDPPADPTWVRWEEGPVVDISIPPDTASRHTVVTDVGTLASHHGWIRLSGRVIAPGVLLTATRGGTWIAALVPDPDAEEYEAGWEVVAINTGRREKGEGSRR